MSREANYFRIGLFLIAASLLFAGGLITFGLGEFFRERLYIETYVDGTVQGVDVGSPVKFRGVQVGKVASIGFTFNEYPQSRSMGDLNYVSLLMEIDREIFPGMFESEFGEILKRNIARGLRVRVEPQGITGMNYLEINYVDPRRFAELKLGWKPRYYYIPSAPGELTNLLDSVNKIMREIEELNIQGISDGTVKLLANLNGAVTNLDAAITGANLKRLSADLSALVNELTTTVRGARLDVLSADARKLLGEIAKSNDELGKVLANVEPASRLDGDDIDATLQNLRIITDNLRRLSVELERDPSRLIWSRPAKPAKVMQPQRRGERDATR